MKKRWLISAGALLGIALVVIYGWQVNKRLQSGIDHPHGSIRYLGAAQGTARFSVPESLHHRLARQWLPLRWQGWIPKRLEIFGFGDSNTLSLFFETRFDPDATNMLPPLIREYWVEDADGHLFPSHFGGGLPFSGPGNNRIGSVSLYSFPRGSLRFESI